ncbi:hypothetical protein [Candidatus Tisiphia endosymbiont of Hybos culiciformis]
MHIKFRHCEELPLVATKQSKTVTRNRLPRPLAWSRNDGRAFTGEWQ